VKLLIDTHILLWLRADPTRLPPPVLEALTDPAHEVFASAASAWEIAIKQSTGKLELPEMAETWFPKALAESGLEPLPVTPEDALGVRDLPWHHRDPFDRLLVAQARRRGLTLVSHDQRLGAYGVELMGA